VISQFRTPCKAMLFKPAFAGSARAVFSVLIMLILFAWMPAAPALAQAATASGLKLPRFVSTRSDPINVRVGPGTKYAIAWNFVVSGVPVEIIQEFDTWRKIRDVDGDEGWVHQSLLVGTRAGFAAPLLANGEVLVRASKGDEAAVRARLGPGFKVTIRSCDGDWCNVSAMGGRNSYNGFVRQEELWGVYPDEAFD
jgi:SH3-like domain-containing protein